MRVYDIRNPLRPREVAYANHPAVNAKDPRSSAAANVKPAPAFDPATGDVWYSDTSTGFWVERLSTPAWRR